MVNQQRMLAEFFEMVKINSLTRNEREMADLMKKKLAELGFEVSEDDVGNKIGGNAGNVIGFIKGTVAGAPTIMLSAHMDCVPPCEGIEPILKDGVITSAGDTILGGDDKAGIAGILEALRQMKEQKMAHGDIQVVLTVAEEGGLNGAKNIDRALLKADFGYVLDSGGAPGELIVMAPGQDAITAVVHGKTAHAGVAPEEGINAIVVAGKALAEMKLGRIDAETTANVGVISGGVATNIVTDRVELKCEARSRNLDKLAAQSQHMKETFEKVAAANGARAEVQVVRAYDPYVLSDEAPIVKLFAKAAELAGVKMEKAATGGGSDANFFNVYGVPTAVLGIGMSKAHTTDEFIKEEHLYEIGKVVLGLIQAAAAEKK